MRAVLLAAALVAAAPTARADIVGRFTESAPTDRFEIVNESGCALGRATLTIDVATAPAGLYFDVTEGGAGVQVFQPLRIVAGAGLVVSSEPVRDGDRAIVLTVRALAPGARVAVTIDVDDEAAAGPRGPTQIGGSEIVGAALRIETDGQNLSGAFGADGRARVSVPGCAGRS